eukprot:Tbor_TRINITY_DN5550_c0_g1::TRINITY_DN5550_c0_g1_i2::g.13695::m.13695
MPRSHSAKNEKDIAYIESKMVPLPLNISLRRFSPGCKPRTLLTAGNLRQLLDGGVYLHNELDNGIDSACTNCSPVVPISPSPVFSTNTLVEEDHHNDSLSYCEKLNMEKNKILSLLYDSGLPTAAEEVAMSPGVDDQDFTNTQAQGRGTCYTYTPPVAATYIPPLIPSLVQKRRLEQIYNSRDHGFNFGLMKKLCQEHIGREDIPCLLILSNCPPPQQVDVEEENKNQGCSSIQDRGDYMIHAGVQDMWLPVVSSSDEDSETDDVTEEENRGHIWAEKGRQKQPEIVGIFFPCSPFDEDRGRQKRYFGTPGIFAFRSMFPEEKEILVPSSETGSNRRKQENKIKRNIRVNSNFLVKIPIPPTPQEIHDMLSKIQEKECCSPNQCSSEGNCHEKDAGDSPQEHKMSQKEDDNVREGEERDVSFNILHRSNDYFVRYTDEELWVGGGGDGPLLRLCEDLSHAQSSSKCYTFGAGYTPVNIGRVNSGETTDAVSNTSNMNPTKPKSGPLFSPMWGAGNSTAAPIAIDCGVAEVDLKCVELWCFAD